MSRRGRWTSWCFGALASATVWVSGCMRIEPAQGDLIGTASIADRSAEAWSRAEAWPARVRAWSGLSRSTVRDLPAQRRPMGFVREINGPIVSMSDRPKVVERIKTEATEDIRIITAVRRRTADRDLRVSAEGPGAYVFATEPEPSPEEAKAAARLTYLKFVSAQELEGPSDQPLHLRIERTWLVFYPCGEPRPRGLIVLAPGMFGNPTDVMDQLIARFNREGWSVLRLAAHPSRFTQRVTFECDVRDPESSGAEIARELTDRAAECAYAVEAACLWLVERHPELAGVPRVFMGLSGGAMVGPTIIARDPDAWAGAILVAGGANFFRVGIDSSYASWVDALRFRFVTREPGGAAVEAVPTPEDRARLDAAYRAHAVLDSGQTARALLGKAVLMIHASGDRAVPAACGDELWESAGRPERWVFGTGHELLFFVLPTHIDRLMEWLGARFPAISAPPDQPASPSPA